MKYSVLSAFYALAIAVAASTAAKADVAPDPVVTGGFVAVAVVLVVALAASVVASVRYLRRSRSKGKPSR